MNSQSDYTDIIQTAEIINETSFLDDGTSVERSPSDSGNAQKVSTAPQSKFHPKYQSIGIPKLLFTTSFGVLYPQMDQLVTSLSLVHMGRQFGVDVDMTQWVLLTYLIVSSVCGAFIGRVGEIMGIDLMFKLAYLGLTIVNIVIISFDNIYVIYVARLFGGLFNSAGVATHAYLQRFLGRPTIITKLMSLQTTGMSIFNIIFPLAVGALSGTGMKGWKYAYIILAVFVCICSILSFVFIPRLPRNRNVKLDPPGICTFLITIVSLVIGISSITFGWAWYVTMVLFAVFIVFLIGFIFIEKKAKNPMIPPKIIGKRDPIILFSIIVIVVGIFSSKSMLMPYVCTIALQLPSIGASLLICITMGVMAICSLVVGKIFGKFITKALFFASLFITSSGSMVMSVGYYFLSIPTMAVGSAVEGMGIGLFFVCMLTTIFRLGGDNITLFSGLNNSFQNIGKSIFTAVVSMGLEVAVKLFLESSEYIPGDTSEENMDIYRTQYGRAAGVTGMIVSGFLYIATVLSLFMNISAGERGRIGFKEKNLSHNKAQTTIMVGVEENTGGRVNGDMGLVEVNDATSFTTSDF